jgi:hypothetical protein
VGITVTAVIISVMESEVFRPLNIFDLGHDPLADKRLWSGFIDLININL